MLELAAYINRRMKILATSVRTQRPTTRSNRRKLRIVLILCCLAFIFCVYKLVIHVRIPADFIEQSRINVSGIYPPTSADMSSVIEIQHSENDDFVVINDVAIKKDFFPEWFWRVSIIKLSLNLRPQNRKESPKVPFIPKPDRQNRNAIWANFQNNIRTDYLYVPTDSTLRALLNDLAYLPIVAIYENKEGTQLKLNVQLKNGGTVLLKPNRQILRNADRHFAEIAAFYLDSLLGFYRVPPTVGRYFNIKTELEPLVSDSYRETIYTTKDHRTCFYGKCKNLCEQKLASCGTPDTIEVSMTYMLPNNTRGDVMDLKQIQNPWMKESLGQINPDWVSEEYLCSKTRDLYASGSPLYLDILDAMYFDMLIDNSDRHHIVLFGHSDTPSIPILLDQGKGFRKECEDETLDNFLYRRGGCCLMKKSTFLKFLKLVIGPEKLGFAFKWYSEADPTSPVLSGGHLRALDRRVNKIVSFITECLKHNHINDVIIDDISPSAR